MFHEACNATLHFSTLWSLILVGKVSEEFILMAALMHYCILHQQQLMIARHKHPDIISIYTSPLMISLPTICRDQNKR